MLNVDSNSGLALDYDYAENKQVAINDVSAKNGKVPVIADSNNTTIIDTDMIPTGTYGMLVVLVK